MIGIGGSLEEANIEVHDIRFVAANSLEDTYTSLKRNWFGKTLHIDEYMIIEVIDNHRVVLKDKPQPGKEKLFFVNMGGSLQQHFGEAHEYGLFVSTTKEEAEARGKAELLTKAYDTHVDYSFEVQDRLQGIDGKVVFIHLEPEKDNSVKNNYYNTYIKL